MHRRSLLHLFFASVALVGCTTGTTTRNPADVPAVSRAFGAYEDCGKAHAARITTSSETAEAVARVALGLCGAQRVALWEAYRDASGYPSAADEFVKGVDKRVGAALAAAVMASR